jgi:hypothetical protein
MSVVDDQKDMLTLLLRHMTEVQQATTTVQLTATDHFESKNIRPVGNVLTKKSIPSFPIGGQFSLGETRQVDLRYPRALLLLKH